MAHAERPEWIENGRWIAWTMLPALTWTSDMGAGYSIVWGFILCCLSTMWSKLFDPDESNPLRDVPAVFAAVSLGTGFAKLFVSSGFMFIAAVAFLVLTWDRKETNQS
jgi:hypothetical protein